MRIAGYIDHPILKITIFQMENRFSVKFEDPHLEQTYKFRQGPGLESVADIKRLIDASFMNKVIEQMRTMRKLQVDTLRRRTEEAEDEFDDIL
jgi:hypothetical protein